MQASCKVMSWIKNRYKNPEKEKRKKCILTISLYRAFCFNAPLDA